MGIQNSLIPAAVGPMVSRDGRASAFGVFTVVYGLAWFAGSALIGLLCDRSVTGAIALCLALEFAAVPFLVAAGNIRPPIAPDGAQ